MPSLSDLYPTRAISFRRPKQPSQNSTSTRETKKTKKTTWRAHTKMSPMPDCYVTRVPLRRPAEAKDVPRFPPLARSPIPLHFPFSVTRLRCSAADESVQSIYAPPFSALQGEDVPETAKSHGRAAETSGLAAIRNLVQRGPQPRTRCCASTLGK